MKHWITKWLILNRYNIYIKSFEGDATFKQFREVYDNLVSKGMKKLIALSWKIMVVVLWNKHYILSELFCNPNQKLLIIEKDKWY